jgi:hypothetical protein
VRKLVACVGEAARIVRICTDLDVHASDRRIIVVQSDHHTDRLRGLRGSGVVWINMGATREMLDICRVQELREVNIHEARSILQKEAKYDATKSG